MDLPVRIGRYDIRARIGRGATADVFLARAPGAPDIALKRLHPHLADDGDAVAQLLGEARLAARLDHPAAVPVVDLGCEDGVWFVAFEHVPGLDLATLTGRMASRGERLPAPIAVAVAADLASALAALHALDEEPLAHGDVSPSNVLISRAGAVRLVDLGACAALARGAPGVFGTPGYVAPEQVSGLASPVGDVYGVAAILLELLTGAPPASGAGLSALAAQHEADDLAERLAAAGVPRALLDVMSQALALDVERRTRTAADLASALAPWAAPADVTRRELAAAVARHGQGTAP